MAQGWPWAAVQVSATFGYAVRAAPVPSGVHGLGGRRCLQAGIGPLQPPLLQVCSTKYKTSSTSCWIDRAR